MVKRLNAVMNLRLQNGAEDDTARERRLFIAKRLTLLIVILIEHALLSAFYRRRVYRVN